METMISRMKELRPVVPLMLASFQYATAFLVTAPFTVDIFLGAICPGQTECSQLMVLMGAQQLASGLCAAVFAPAVGGLSDDYGRKPVLMVIFFSTIVPNVILACSETKLAVYVWFLLGIFISILRDGVYIPTCFAYVADVVDENLRALALGLTLAASSIGFIVGTTAAFAIQTAFQAYWIATILQILGATYVMLFVKETNPRRPLLPAEKYSQSDSTTKLLPTPVLKTQTSKLKETARTIWNSQRLRTIVAVKFTYGLVGSTSGIPAFTLYYLKFTFNYGKDQFAMLSMVNSVGTTIGEMVVYPSLTYLCGDRGVLWIGLLGSSAHFFMFSLAWTSWVPYIAGAMTVFWSLIPPSLGIMVSRGVDHEHQGKVQGFLSGARSTAAIVAPLVLTPITAASFGDNPPLHSRTLPFVFGGSVMIVGLLIALGLPRLPPSEIKFAQASNYIPTPRPPEHFIHRRAPPEGSLHGPFQVHPESSTLNNLDDDT